MPKFILSTTTVSESIAKIRSQLIHPHFAAYLCLRRTACQQNRLKDLCPDFKEFFSTFLAVPDAPQDKPYLRLFLDTPPSDQNIWLNKNLAGSFAPSSIRNTLLQVLNVKKKEHVAFYSFRETHWRLARDKLLSNKRIPVIPLIAALYRSYAFNAPKLTPQVLMDVFKDEFGYNKTFTNDEEFTWIFDPDESILGGTDWHEKLN
jgi:hypothetical protein